MASSGEQGRAGVRAVCGAPDFFDGLGQWACQEAAGREKLGSKTPAPAQEVGVSRRRPLAPYMEISALHRKILGL